MGGYFPRCDNFICSKLEETAFDRSICERNCDEEKDISLVFRRFRYDSIFTANDRCIGCRGKPIRRLNKADPFSPLVYPRPCQIISPSLWRKSLGPRRLFRSNYIYIYIYICMCVSKTKTKKKKKRRRKDDGEGRIAERECSRVEGRGREGRERSRAERKHMPGRLVPRRSKPRIS